jgi:hypothetical protein
MTEYIVETRIFIKAEDDEQAKLQIATLLGLYKLGGEDGVLKIRGIEMGLLRDNKSVDLPIDNVHQLYPRREN